MGKRSLAIITIVLIVFLITACAQNKEPIKIGFTVGLTGVLADEGVSARNGYLIAVEEVNALGGINGRIIEPVVKNDESSQEVGLLRDKEFYEEGVQFVVGHLLSSMTPVVEKGMEDYGLVYISPTMATNVMTNKDDNFFRVIGDTSVMALSIAEMVIQEEGIEDFLIIYDESNAAFSGTVKDVLTENLSLMGIDNISHLPYNEGDEYAVIARHIRDAQVDGVAIINSSVVTANILQQMSIIELDIPRFTSTWALSSELIFKGGRATDGLYGVGFYDRDSQVESFTSFVNRYEERFAEEPSHTSFFAYEATMLLIKALESSDSTETEDVIRALKNTGAYNGLADSYFINEFGDAERPYVKIQIIDGKMKKVQ